VEIEIYEERKVIQIDIKNKEAVDLHVLETALNAEIKANHEFKLCTSVEAKNMPTYTNSQFL